MFMSNCKNCQHQLKCRDNDYPTRQCAEFESEIDQPQPEEVLPNFDRKILYHYWVLLPGDKIINLNAQNDFAAEKEAIQKCGKFGRNNIYSINRQFVSYL